MGIRVLKVVSEEKCQVLCTCALSLFILSLYERLMIITSSILIVHDASMMPNFIDSVRTFLGNL